MFLTGRLAPCFGLEKIFQMMAWRVMAYAVVDSFWGRNELNRKGSSWHFLATRQHKRGSRVVASQFIIFVGWRGFATYPTYTA